jgi:transposase
MGKVDLRRVGAYSAAVLEYEMKGLGRFKNRRQVSSYTGLCPGLCPGIHLSDGRAKRARSTAVAWGCTLDLGGDGLAPDEG